MNTISRGSGWVRWQGALGLVMVLGLMVGCGTKTQPEVFPPILSAVMTGDLDEVRRLVDEGADLNSSLGVGVTAYNVARIRGYEEIASFLESKGAKTDVASPSAGALTDHRLESMAGSDHSALVVLVARGDQVVYRRALGMADIGEAIPATMETRFRIGSVSKQFTAAAILRLHEKSELKLTDPLSKFYPEVSNATNVTLHHLLTHTSGLHSYTSKPDFMERVTEAVEPKALMEYFASDPPDFEPGAKWSYCNSGYFLLGEIVAQVSGVRYGEFLEKEFFVPLGMTSSGVHERGSAMGPQAVGYSASEGGLELAKDWHMSWAGGAGALYSTADDLLMWNHRLLGGKVLDEASLDLMLTPVEVEADIEPGPKDTGYGYGVAVGRQRGLRTVGHSGGLNGFSSMLVSVPEEELTVVVLFASLPGLGGAEASGLATDIVEYHLWEKMEPRRELKVDSSIGTSAMEKVSGRYDYGAPLIMSVSTRDGRLFAQLSGQPEFEIFPRSATEFYWKVVEASIVFQTNGQGRVTGAIHRQGGGEQVVARLPDLEEVTLSAEILDGLVGKYDYGSAMMTVTRVGETLFAQLEGQPRSELYASSPTNFHWRLVDAHVTFVRDGTGKVVKGIHEQGGRKFDVRKTE